MLRSLSCLAIPILAAAALLAAPSLAAAEYPDKPIRIVIPYPPGGATDTIGRQLAHELSERLKTPVVIDNRGGAGGIPGAELASRATPDGYTLMLTVTSLVQQPALRNDISFDVEKAFDPISEIGRTHNLLVVPASSGIKTFEDFVSRMKAEPGKHSYGSYGAGTSAHIYGEMLKKQAGIDLTHVPYRGGNPLAIDILGEALTLGIVDNVSIQPHMNSGKFNVIAVTGADRSPLAPEAPKLAELGLTGFDTYGWIGMFAPAGVPDPILDRLSDEATAIVAGDTMGALIEKVGLVKVGSDRKAFTETVRNDLALWAKLVKDTGVTLD